MTRRRRARKTLIDFSGTRKTIDILRDSHAVLDRHQNRLDDEAETAAHDAELRRCRNDIILLPSHDPKRIAAERRLKYLTSNTHLAWRKIRPIPGRLWRSVRHELILAFLIPLQVLLIVAFNVAAFLILWWILFSF